jgi:MYXO-CTERM domain-containing protein
MRIALASTVAAAAMFAAPAFAIPYSPSPMDFAQFQISIVDGSTGVHPLSLGDSTTNLTPGPNTNSGTSFEFDSVNNFISDLTGFNITFSLGAANVGRTFTTGYDRADNTPAAVGTGTFTFTLGATTFVSLGPAGNNQSFQIEGLLTVSDGAGDYDDGVDGSWSFGGSINEDGDIVAGLTVSVPPNPTRTSEPGMLALAGAGLLGLAFVRRRVG